MAALLALILLAWPAAPLRHAAATAAGAAAIPATHCHDPAAPPAGTGDERPKPPSAMACCVAACAPLPAAPAATPVLPAPRAIAATAAVPPEATGSGRVIPPALPPPRHA
ncbi:hypothetical protein [Paracraurococcus ruber]|uniref:hypothetical protein n=1 Tax=Paracraurococcus ruber TaxID=77675 RepID=UPI00130523C8|nr:hypothetical protein [Paracraurococcus ruber]